MKPIQRAPRRWQTPIACLAALAAPALAAVPSGPADNAAFKTIMPPPGLYKVEMNAKQTDAGMDGLAYSRKYHMNPDSGAVALRYQDRAGQSVSVQHAGQGPATMCMTAHKITASPFSADCKAEPGVVVNGELRLASQCGADHVTLAVRKTGPTTWEYRTSVLVADGASGSTGSAGSADGMAALPRAVLENLAKNGPTSSVRADAARALAEQSARPAHAAVQPAAAPAFHGGARHEITTVQTLTRIADACSAAAR